MLELFYKSLPLICAVLFMVIFFGHNKSIWDNYWHLGLSVLFAAASLIALHYGKEEKANKAKMEIEEATGALKVETEKLTNALKYGTIFLKMAVSTPELKFDFETDLPNQFRHRRVPEFIIKNYRPVLTFIRGGKRSTYQLSPEPFDYGNFNFSNSISGRDELSFRITMKFILNGPLNTKIEELKKDGILHLYFYENDSKKNLKILDYLNNKIEIKNCQITLANGGEKYSFNFKGQPDMGYMMTDDPGLLFVFDDQKKVD